MTINILELTPIDGGELHASVVDRLDPEYVEFYNATYVGRPQVQERPPSTFKLAKGGYIPGDLPPEPVGKIETIYVERKYTKLDLPPIPVTVWYPATPAPSSGWPAAYMIHGGGWVLGNSLSEESSHTRLCNGADVVVISPDYRLAPDAPYPAAVEDCWEVLMWLWERGSQRLGIDKSNLIIGGASAGGHLSSTMINLLIDRPEAPKDLKFKLNVMVVPVTDNTAGEPQLGSPTWNDYLSWTENAHGPTLPASKMMWYRNLFIPNPEYRLHWAASPMLAPKDFWAKHPPTWVGVCEVDVLRDEGIAFAEKLKEAGVPCELRMYKGMPHPAIQQAGALKTGARFHADLVAAVRKALA